MHSIIEIWRGFREKSTSLSILDVYHNSLYQFSSLHGVETKIILVMVKFDDSAVLNIESFGFDLSIHKTFKINN